MEHNDWVRFLSKTKVGGSFFAGRTGKSRCENSGGDPATDGWTVVRIAYPPEPGVFRTRSGPDSQKGLL
jgi:hypothetical protein